MVVGNAGSPGAKAPPAITGIGNGTLIGAAPLLTMGAPGAVIITPGAGTIPGTIPLEPLAETEAAVAEIEVLASTFAASKALEAGSTLRRFLAGGAATLELSATEAGRATPTVVVASACMMFAPIQPRACPVGPLARGALCTVQPTVECSSHPSYPSPISGSRSTLLVNFRRFCDQIFFRPASCL